MSFLFNYNCNGYSNPGPLPFFTNFLKESNYCLPISTAVNFCIFSPLLFPVSCSFLPETPSIFCVSEGCEFYVTSVVELVEEQQETIGYVNRNSDSECDSECDACGGAIWG